MPGCKRLHSSKMVASRMVVSMLCSSSVWTFPIATVSQSEGGFELVHQSSAVIPHWEFTPDESGASAQPPVEISSLVRFRL